MILGVKKTKVKAKKYNIKYNQNKIVRQRLDYKGNKMFNIK